METKLIQTCNPCCGTEVSSIPGEENISDYTGDFPSPLQIMNYHQDEGEKGKHFWPDPEIRTWVEDAANYHGVPHSMLAVVLQQENAPSVSKGRQLLQFGERQITTFAAVLDEFLLDIVPDKASRGSTGFANMSFYTLKEAAEYSERNCGKNPLPNNVRFRLLDWDSDTRIPGYDWKADLYYAAAHLRELIDRTTGDPCHSGPLTDEQAQAVFAAYNGSGPMAVKYGSDAMSKLDAARQDNGTLYFFQRSSNGYK